jgi:anti-anti-sigma regulatory factor
MAPASQGPAALYLGSPEPGVSLLQVEGALSTGDAPRWRQALARAIEATRGVIVDLRGCSFLAVACVREMLDASDDLASQGKGRLRIVMDVGVGDTVAQRVWALARDRFSFHPSTARALHATRGA